MDCGHIQPDSEFYVDPTAVLLEEKKRKREGLIGLRKSENERSVSNNISTVDKEAMGQNLNNVISEISNRKRQSKTTSICSLHNLPLSDGSPAEILLSENKSEIPKKKSNEGVGAKEKRQKKVS